MCGRSEPGLGGTRPPFPSRYQALQKKHGSGLVGNDSVDRGGRMSAVPEQILIRRRTDRATPSERADITRVRDVAQTERTWIGSHDVNQRKRVEIRYVRAARVMCIISRSSLYSR